MAGPYTIGVDVGGTKILAGIIDGSSGAVVSLYKIASPPVGAEPMMEAITEACDQVIKLAPEDVQAQVQAIGLGLAGQVDRENGILLFAPNLGGGVSNVAIRQPLHDRFSLPIVLGNDVEVAALGEASFGAGKGNDNFACVFVGTGIGGALMRNGERVAGATGTAGEIGHIIVKAGGRKCGCGGEGHLEAYASRTAMVLTMKKAVEEKGRRSVLEPILRDPSQRVKSRALFNAIAERDTLVIETMLEGGYYLGLGLISLINLYNPSLIVLGGGVIDRVDLLYTTAVNEAKKGALRVPAQQVQIVKSALGDQSGIVGAAVMAARTIASSGPSLA